MKKQYITPRMRVTEIESNNIMLTGSMGTSDTPADNNQPVMSKGNIWGWTWGFEDEY